MEKNSSPALSVRSLSVNYDQTPVLWDISFEIPRGKIVGIIGPNGAGKSTLLKAVLGLTPSLSGKVEIFDSTLSNIRQRVAYVPQRESVDWDFPITVIELVLMGRYGRLGLFRRPRKADREEAMRFLETVGMEGYAHRQINQLSGGQQQRVFLARALMQEADLYFMDEPLNGIDLGTEKLIMNLLKQLQASGKSLFIVHHDLNTVESYFDWCLLLNIRLVASGPTKEVFTPQNLNTTYGKSYALFDEALKLSSEKQLGL